MKDFKLMQIVPSLESGGVETGTIDLCNYLSNNNYKNYIASNGGKLLDSIKNNNIHHLKLPLKSKNFLIYPFIANKLQKEIYKLNINILHFRSRAPSWLLPFLSRKNIFTISTFHNVYGNQNLIKYYYNRQLGNVDSIVAISNYVKNEIIKQYALNENKITVINRGCDFDFFNPNDLKEIEIKKFKINYKIPENKNIILFPGRLTSWKGQIEFLEIINHFKNNKNLFFIYVGDGKNVSYKNNLLRKIKEYGLELSCLVLDHLTKNNLKIMYYLSKIIISAPLKPEGFGRSISEALSMKRVILAYNYGGVKDQLDNLNDIYKIEPQNNKMLIDKINIVNNLKNEEFENLSNESRLIINKFFSKDMMLNKYLELYQKS